MKKIIVSAPGKVHLLGEWAVVWGKPALLTSVDLRISASITPGKKEVPENEIRNVIEPIVKKYLKIKSIPSYRLDIESKLPVGAGLGSSAAISAAYITSLLSFLKIKQDLNFINELTYEAEKVFSGNPSGADNSTVVFGGLIWFRKELPDLKTIQPLSFSIPLKLAKNFMLINTGTPKQTTRQMISKITSYLDKKPALKKRFLKSQEELVKQFIPAIKNSDQKEVIRIIKTGEKNLESIGVVSSSVKIIIRQIEKKGGAAKICGAGASEGPTGVLLVFHQNLKVVEKLAKDYNLDCFQAKLGVIGIKNE